MIGPRVIEFADLQRLSGYTRLADVERWAVAIGLPVQRCRGGVFTTLDAVNHALGVPGVDAPLYDGDVV